MKLIPLSGGFFAKVDDEDYEYLSGWVWYRGSSKYGYAFGYPKNATKNRNYMHRLIMKATHYKQYVDHINHDTLDNQKSNLRICTPTQNNANRKKSNTKNKYKGVQIHHNHWRALITYEGKRRILGCFESDLEASKVYNTAALELFGNYALI